MRCVLLLLCGLMTALFAPHASAQVVAVLPMELAPLAGDAQRAQTALDEILKSALGGGYVPVRAAVDCAEAPACLVSVVQGARANQVLRVRAMTLNEGDAWAAITFDLYGPDGKHFARLEDKVTTRTGWLGLEMLVDRAFRPASYKGTLHIKNLQAGDRVLVDGLAVAGTDVQLSAGRHRVVVQRGSHGGAREFVVPYRGDVTVDVGGLAVAPFPWGLVVAPGAGVVGLGFVVAPLVALPAVQRTRVHLVASSAPDAAARAATLEAFEAAVVPLVVAGGITAAAATVATVVLALDQPGDGS